MYRSPEHIYDEWLVLRAQDGEIDAMNELVSRWHRRLGVHARCLVSDEASAADALQDAWYDIVRGIRKLADPAAYRVWMYRIVSRRCTDHLRRKRRWRDRMGFRASEAHSEVGLVDSRPPPDATAQIVEESDRLREALASLPGERRAMLALRYRENLPLAAIAMVMNCPSGTVKSRLHEARRQLHTLLDTTQGKG